MSIGLGRSVLAFKPIDFDAHGHVCIAFRRDTFMCSFGWDGFLAGEGDEGESYLKRLLSRSSRFPDGYVHAWNAGEIVGQVEMRVLDDPRRGHVSLFYLAEQSRGSGLGDDLQQYAMRFMRSQGVGTAQLNVSPTNIRALNYYRKHGWMDGLRLATGTRRCAPDGARRDGYFTALTAVRARLAHKCDLLPSVRPVRPASTPAGSVVASVPAALARRLMST